MPVDASELGWKIDRLITITSYQTALVGGLALLVLIAALVRRRRPAVATSRPWAWPLALAGAVFLAIDGHLLIASTRDLHGTYLAIGEAEAAPDAVRIEINAQQWAWNIRYPGVDDQFGTDDDVVVLNELWLPAGRNAIVELAAVDVIHSFYLPSFRVKQDAVPGRITRTWFRPIRLGDYEIACAEFCGVHHYKMRGRVRVVSPERFEAWIAAMSADAVRIAAEHRRGSKGAPDPRRWAWPWQGAQP
jgi:cytochrome c oxidase subunit 2